MATNPSILQRLLERTQSVSGPLRSIFGGQQPSQPAFTPDPAPADDAPQVTQPEEDFESLSNTFLRGLINRASAFGEPVPPQLFEERYKKSISPAREFLANFLYGLSSGLTGQKFRSVRERAFEQFLAEQQQRQEAQQQLQQQFGNQVQLAGLLASIVRQREENQLRKEIEQIKLQSDAFDREAKLAEIAIKAEQLGIDRQKLMAQIEQQQWERQDTGDKEFDTARRMVLPELQAQGVDLSTPQGQNLMWQAIYQRWKQIIDDKARIDAKYRENKPDLAATTYIGPDGNTYMAIVDKRSQRVVGGVEIGRQLTSEQVQNISAIREAASNVRRALQVAQNSPDIIGSFASRLPLWLRNQLGTMSSDERMIRQHFNKAISDYVLSVSGKAVTDKEREFLMEGLPPIYSRPRDFFPAAYSFATMLDAAALRTQYGVDIDLTGPMREYKKAMESYFRKNRTMEGFRILSADEFLQIAAKYYGKRIVKEFGGQIRLENAK
jgi:hypothetical protein